MVVELPVTSRINSTLVSSGRRRLDMVSLQTVKGTLGQINIAVVWHLGPVRTSLRHYISGPTDVVVSYVELAMLVCFIRFEL